MKKAILLLTLWCSLSLNGQNLNAAEVADAGDLEKALQNLSQLRGKIEQERIPLAKELNSLENEALAKRQEADHNKRVRENREVDISTMEQRIKNLKDNNGYLASQLGDYIRRFKTNLHIGEQQIYQDRINEATLASENTNLGEKEKFTIQLKAIEVAFERLENVLGGHIFEGSAVTPEGSYEKGKFVIIGPVSYFSSSNGGTGLAQREINASNAVIKDIGKKFASDIDSLAANGTGFIPIDTTLGDALRLAATKETLVEHIKNGGIVMYPILGLATFAFIVAVFKWFEIGAVTRARPRDLHIILDFLRAGEREKALGHAKSVKGPVGEMLIAAVSNSEAEKEFIEEVLYERIITTQPHLERMLPLIAVTAATAPLLGLLGTVTGMIRTFKLITVFGTGNAGNLASGISEALITTKFGLIIAIPALILHALLSRKAKGVVASMEQTAVGFVNGLSEIKKTQ